MIELSVAGQIATVRFSNPLGVNLMTRAAVDELDRIFGVLECRTDIGAVVVTGSEGKGFLMGGDASELAQLSGAAGEELARVAAQVFARVRRFRRPVAAVINGDALGAGLLLALMCDVRLASLTARVGYPEIKLGLLPGAGGIVMLARLIGVALARRLCLLGELLDASEARGLGLVDRVVEPARLQACVEQTLAQLAAAGDTAVREIKATCEAVLMEGLHSAFEQETRGFRCCFEDSQSHAALRAFLDRSSRTR